METLYEKSSLILNPGVYDTGKVYCTKPFDGSGDLTFTRNSNATRVNADGLVEKVRTNLALYSEQFDNAYWIKAGATITANSTTSPNGTTTADKITEQTNNGVHRWTNTAYTTTADRYTWSIYAKAAERDWIRLSSYNGTQDGSAFFNLSTGTIGSTANVSATIESVGNGWYRCAITHNSAFTAASNAYYAELRLSSDGSAVSYLGDGISGAFVWGGQFELSDFGPTPYIPTTSAAVSVGPTANVPRLDYSGGCPSLLLEPQRTNIAYPSETMTGYAKSSAITLTGGAAISPQGYQNATYYFCNTTTTNGYLLPSFNGTSGIQYAVSFYAKAKELTRIYIKNVNDSGSQSWFELSDGTYNHLSGIDSMSIESVGNGWYRCIAVSTSSSTGIKWIPIIKGNANEGVYIWGLQIEAGSYATSYIPTGGSGASVTRLADDARKTSIASLIGQTAGTIFLEFEHNGIAKNHYSPIVSLQGTASPMELIEIYAGIGSTYYACVMQDGGVTQFNTPFQPQYGTNKLAFAYGLNDSVLYVNGSIVGAVDTSCTIPTLYDFALGNFTYSTGWQYGEGINQVLLFKTRLTNAQLAELTTL